MLRPGFLATLEIPGYRWLLLTGIGVSAAFTADGLATGWLVLQLTDSPFWLGLVAGTRGVSQLVFSVVGGTIADRINLRRLLIQNNLINAALSLVVMTLVVSGTVQIWFILVAQVVAGFLGALNGPANQALLYDVVGRARLLNARAFGFMTGGVMRILTSVATGFVISTIGTGQAYALVAVAYVFGACCLFPLPRGGELHPAEPPLRSLVSGLRYVWRTERIRELLLLSFTTEAFGFAHMQMVPVMARDVLHVDADGLGLLSAFSAGGQLAAMVMLASFGDVRRKNILLLASAFAYGASILAFAASHWFVASLAIMMFVGGTAGLYDSTIATVIQLTVHGEMRGRVLGVYVASWGSNPVGSFGLGVLATFIGPPLAIAAFAAVVCGNALRLIPKLALLDPARAEPGQDRAPLRA